MPTAVTPIQMFEITQLGTALATVFTLPATPTGAVLCAGRIRVTNVGAGMHTVSANIVPAGSAAAGSNQFLNAEGVGINQHTDFDIPNMAPGDTLQMSADAAAVINVAALNAVVVR